MARASFIKKAVGRPRRRSKSAGTYLRHFTETLCRAEITIAIVIIGCVMRTMRLVDAEIPPHCLSRGPRFDRKRQSDRKNIRLPGMRRPEEYDGAEGWGSRVARGGGVEGECARVIGRRRVFRAFRNPREGAEGSTPLPTWRGGREYRPI